MANKSLNYHENYRRHELDRLKPSTDVDAAPARPEELATLVEVASRSIPTINIMSSVVQRVHTADPSTVFPFRVNGEILGGIAFLYLNSKGLDDLLLDLIDFSNPDPTILAEHGEEPAAIYVWALAARGRGAAGIGNVSARLRQRPYAYANYYAQPATPDGRRLLAQLGFEPTPSYQPDLWIYQRLCRQQWVMPCSAFHLSA